MYKSVNNSVVSDTVGTILMSDEHHSFATHFSFSNNLYVPKPRTIMQRGISYKGVPYWNDMPFEVKNCDNSHCFLESC